MSAGAGARQERFGQSAPEAGLLALARLVNEALARMGTRPAFAGPMFAQPAFAGPMFAQPAVDSPRSSGSTGSTSSARAAGKLRSAPSPTPRRPAPQRPEPEPDPQPDYDAEHVETWRLVHLAQDGDGEAFGQLYDRYVDTVFRFIYFRVNDRSLAEDFTSETFLRALRRIGTISYQGRDIGAWFVTIARNIVLDHMKSARHRLETPTADTIEGREHAESTEAAVLDTLQSQRLMRAVTQLGDEQRECIVLRFIQGMSVSETAAIMRKNDGAIKALQHRAVRKLADLIGDDLR